MEARTELILFFVVGHAIISGKCSWVKHHISCFCTNEIHIIFKQLSEEADAAS